jgi:hypothetical protein
MPKWSFRAEYFQACSCDYGCPCEFQAPPTRGFCEGVGAWRILEGHFDAVCLDGLALGFAARWPQAIHLGNGTIAIFVDERASKDQRNALLGIASGQAGGMPFSILATTFSKVLDPLFVPFHFDSKGKHSAASMGDAVRMKFSPVKNPVTGEPEGVRVEHETGFIFKSAEVVNAEVCDSSVPGVSFSWPGKAGFVTTIEYHN